MHRAPYLPSLGLIASLVSWVACSQSAPADMPVIPAAPAHGYQLKTPSFSLASGEEKYLCYTVTLDEAQDIAITQFDPFVTDVVHHYEVYQTLLPEQSGLWDCTQQQIKETWLPLFGGGVGAQGMTLPSGTGFRIPGTAQLLMQLHLVNATPAAIDTLVAVNMTYADDASRVTPAGIFAVGTMNINLAPGEKNRRLTAGCQLPKDLNVFAVQPHMHKLGKVMTFDYGADAASATTIYKRDPWVFGGQPIDPFVRTLKRGDYMSTSCTYDNTTDKTVSYGETTRDEMCYFVLFYTPFDRLGGCID